MNFSVNSCRVLNVNTIVFRKALLYKICFHRELHSTIVAVVCSTYYEPCVKEARRLYDRFMNNPEEFMQVTFLHVLLKCVAKAEEYMADITLF